VPNPYLRAEGWQWEAERLGWHMVQQLEEGEGEREGEEEGEAEGEEEEEGE